MSEKVFMKRQETAEYMGISLSTLDKLIVRNNNPVPHVRAGRRVLIPKDALNKWIMEEMKQDSSKTGD